MTKWEKVDSKKGRGVDKPMFIKLFINIVRKLTMNLKSNYIPLKFGNEREVGDGAKILHRIWVTAAALMGDATMPEIRELNNEN